MLKQYLSMIVVAVCLAQHASIKADYQRMTKTQIERQTSTAEGRKRMMAADVNDLNWRTDIPTGALP